MSSVPKTFLMGSSGEEHKEMIKMMVMSCPSCTSPAHPGQDPEEGTSMPTSDAVKTQDEYQSTSLLVRSSITDGISHPGASQVLKDSELPGHLSPPEVFRGPSSPPEVFPGPLSPEVVPVSNATLFEASPCTSVHGIQRSEPPPVFVGSNFIGLSTSSSKTLAGEELPLQGEGHSNLVGLSTSSSKTLAGEGLPLQGEGHSNLVGLSTPSSKTLVGEELPLHDEGHLAPAQVTSSGKEQYNSSDARCSALTTSSASCELVSSLRTSYSASTSSNRAQAPAALAIDRVLPLRHLTPIESISSGDSEFSVPSASTLLYEMPSCSYGSPRSYFPMFSPGSSIMSMTSGLRASSVTTDMSLPRDVTTFIRCCNPQSRQAFPGSEVTSPAAINFLISHTASSSAISPSCGTVAACFFGGISSSRVVDVPSFNPSSFVSLFTNLSFPSLSSLSSSSSTLTHPLFPSSVSSHLGPNSNQLPSSQAMSSRTVVRCRSPIRRRSANTCILDLECTLDSRTTTRFLPLVTTRPPLRRSWTLRPSAMREPAGDYKRESEYTIENRSSYEFVERDGRRCSRSYQYTLSCRYIHSQRCLTKASLE